MFGSNEVKPVVYQTEQEAAPSSLQRAMWRRYSVVVLT
jgi:hypothetical protein